MADAGVITATLVLNNKQYIASLEEANAATQEAGNTAEGAANKASNSWKSTANAIGDVGGNLIKIGAGVELVSGGVIAATAKMASDFQTSMQNIAGNTNMSTKQLDFMKQTVLAMGKESGASFDDLGQGFMHITNLGYQGADSVNILHAAMESAVATGANVSDVANSLAMSMKDFGLSGKDAQNTINIIHTAAAQGNMTLEQMATAFGQSAGEAGNMGMSLNDTAAAMSALTRHGVDASEAGTQLKNLLVEIAAPTSAAKKGIEALSQSTGVDLTFDFSQAGLKAKGLQGVMNDLTAATHGNLAEIKSAIPNIRGMYGAFVLSGNGASDYTATLKAMGVAVKENTVSDLYNQKLQTTGQIFQRIERNAQAVAITLGNVFLPKIDALLNKIAPIIGLVGNWVAKNANLVASILEGAAAVGGLLIVIGSVMKAIQLVMLVMSPIGLTVLAIVGLITLLSLAWANNWLNIRGITQSAVTAIKSFMQAHKQTISDVMTFVGDIFKSIGRLIEQNFLPAFKEIQTTITPLLGPLKTLGEVVGVALVVAFSAAVVGISAAIGIISSVLTGFVHIFTGVIQIVAGLIQFFVDLFTGNFSKLGSDLGEIWDGIKNIIVGAWQATIGAVWNGIRSVIGFFQNLYDTLIGHSIIPDLVNGIEYWFKNLISSGLNWGKDFINNLVSGITGGVGKVTNSISNIADKIKSFLHFSKPDTGPLADADKWMPDMINMMVQGVNNGMPQLNMALNNAIKSPGGGGVPMSAAGSSYQYQYNVTMSGNYNNQWQQNQDMKRLLQSLTTQARLQ